MTFKIKAVIGLVFAVAAAGLIGWLASTARVSMAHPRADGVRLVKSPGSDAFKPMRDKGPAPKAEADESKFDFGVIDPLTMGAHTFIVRNTGAAPLTLEKGPTTCRCTLSRTSRRPIPPGGSGEVTLAWNSGNKKRAFLQTAEIITNEPGSKRLRFQITGLVRMGVGADRDEIVFTDLPPDESGRGEALIYSQLHEAFSIDSGESTLTGLTWRAEPAAAADLEAVQALSGYRLFVDLPAGLPTGHFAETLRLQVKTPTATVLTEETSPTEKTAPTDETPSPAPAETIPAEAIPAEGSGDPNTVELVIAGNVLRRLAIYGEGIDEQGVVDLGLIRRGQKKSLKLLVKIRDPQPDVEFEPIVAEPSLLQVRISPHRGIAGGASGASRGLYQLEIEVPADAEKCYHVAPHFGRIRLRPKHPRVEEVELKVNFAVISSVAGASGPGSGA